MAVVTKKRKSAPRKRNSVSNSQAEALALEQSQDEVFEDVSSLEYTTDCMIKYGTKTLEDRAIPDFRDGLIPVQRRILYSMYKSSTNNLTKAARIVGDAMGKYHPHGDSAVYTSMVTLVQAPLRLIDGGGNWGSYDNSKSFAAMRYTESKLSALARRIFFDGYMPRAMDMIANFDGEDVEPVTLHANIPVLLALGRQSGIAVGMVTNIPSFSLESVAHLTKHVLSGKKVTPKLVHETLVNSHKYSWGECSLAPKHLTDGSWKSVITNGSGALSFKPKYEADMDTGIVTIKSVPPCAKFDTCVAKTYSAGFSYSDATTVDSTELDLRIGVKTSRTAKVTQADVDKAVKCWTGSTIPVLIAVTDRGYTEESVRGGADELDTKLIAGVGICEYLNMWAEYRLDLEVKMARIEKSDLAENVRKIDLIILARENFDTVKDSLEEDDPYSFLAESLEIDIEDAKYILGLTLIRLSRTDIDASRKQIRDLKARIKECNARIKNPAPTAVLAVDRVLEIC